MGERLWGREEDAVGIDEAVAVSLFRGFERYFKKREKALLKKQR
jgi:hypothetical protein